MTDLTKDLSESLHITLHTSGCVHSPKIINNRTEANTSNEGNEGKVLPVADSSFSKGKTGQREEKAAAVRGSRT